MSSVVNQLSSSSMSEEEEAFTYSGCLRTSYVFSYVLDAAIQLGLFDILAKAGPDAQLSSYEIASQLPTNNPDSPSLLDRMLQLLSGYGLVTCVSRNLDGDGDGDGDGDANKVEKLYGLALPGKAFVRDENEGSLAAFIATKAMNDVWLHLKDLVLEGGNIFEKVHGMSVYQFMSLNPQIASEFDAAMVNVSKIIVKKVLERYQGFQGITKLVDVGGGYGITLNLIISKYPSIKGINYDMPHVIQQAPSSPGIEYIAGDMFSSIPKADAIILKDILHNWDDERCLKILKNCKEALPEKGKVIVISYAMFEEPEPSNAAKFISQMDLIMAVRDGAKQRTENQFKAMSEAAGFSNFQLMCRIFNVVAVMEFYK